MKNEKIQWKKWNWLLYGILGFLCPPLGFALFVYFDIKDPKIARAAGIGALIPIVLPISYIFLTGFPESIGALAFLILRILWIWFFFWQTLFPFKKNEVFFYAKISFSYMWKINTKKRTVKLLLFRFVCLFFLFRIFADLIIAFQTFKV